MDLRTPRGAAGQARRVASAAFVLVAAVASIAVVATGAIFTDTQSVGSNAFTTGTIDVSTTPASAVLSATSMAPGDSDEASLTVNNAGSLQMRYAVQRSATDADSKNLRGSLRLRIALQAGGSCDFPYYTTAGTATSLTDDTQLYEGLGFGGTAADTIGSAVQGSQSGDRTLNASASEVLCFSVVLPTSAGNTLQNATTDVSFDFVAEQTANN